MMFEHDSEPIEGLPADLPAGERILWQGKPCWRGLAKRAFHARTISIYLAVLLLWHAASGLWSGYAIGAVAGSLLLPIALACGGVAIVAGLAWVYARSIAYTITTRRLIIRSGVAIPMTINIPFKAIASASFKKFADGTGDLPVQTSGNDRIAYLHLWPNARPWFVKKPEPMLRSIFDVEKVSEILSSALRTETLAERRRQSMPEQEETPAGRPQMASMLAAE